MIKLISLIFYTVVIATSISGSRKLMRSKIITLLTLFITGLHSIISLAEEFEHRRIEALENYPLSDLKIEAIIEYNKQKFALMNANGDYYIVKKGHYIGLNYGEILTISKQGLEIEEYYYVNNSPDWKRQKRTLKFKINIPQQEVISTTQHREDVAGNTLSFISSTIKTRELLFTLLSLANTNGVISTQINSVSRLNVEHISWDSALKIVLNEAQLEQKIINSIRLITTTAEMPEHIIGKKSFNKEFKNTGSGELLSFYFHEVDIIKIFTLISEFSGKKIQIDPNIQGKISLIIIEKPWQSVLALLSQLHGFTVQVSDKQINIKAPY
ncbi:MAG: pilus assembly protein PilP [Pseudomonadota bacterium]